MRIARERHLDDSTRWFLGLELSSRTAEMHSAMDALSPEQRQAIGDAMVDALNRIAEIVEPVAIERGARPVRLSRPLNDRQ
jgi:hypothetical protein